MRIAYLTHPLTFQRVGGLQNHLRHTMGAVQSLGHEVAYFCDGRDRLQDFDVLHYFSCHHGAHVAVQAAQVAGVPVVLTSMLFPPIDGPGGWASRVVRLYDDVARRLLRRLSQPELQVETNWHHRRRALAGATTIAAWGEQEVAMLQRWFGVERGRIAVVPLGLVQTVNAADPGPFLEAHRLEPPFVLMPSTVEGCKNQLGLIRALRGTGTKLVLLGRAEAEYLRACLREGGDAVRHLEPVPPDSPLLASAYRAAAAVACVSLFESGPLIALEALAAGRPVLLTTSNGLSLPVSPWVIEVDPRDRRRMRAGVAQLLGERPSEAECRALVAGRTWAEAARALQDLYRRAAPR